MTQSNPIIGANKSGLQYRSEDNDGKKSLLNHHKGSSAPSYAEAGIIWLDDAATPWLLKIYDGADWITLGAANAGTNTFTPYYGMAAPRFLNHATDTGSANAYAIAPSPAAAAYATGQVVTLKPVNANTGASTINVNSLGVKNIKLLSGADPAANAMVTTGVYILVYDGASFILTNPSGSSVTFDSLSPMTTVGDTIYGGTSGAGTRLAGNTAATKKVLVSEGTGSAAQAPSWGLAVGTSANNLVQLDGTAKLPAVDGSQLTNLPSTGYNPRTALDYIQDFVGAVTAVTVDGAVGAFGAYAKVAGTGAQVGFMPVSKDGRGAAVPSTGTSSSGIAAINILDFDNVSTSGITQSATGAYSVEFRVRVPTLSDGTNRFKARIGMGVLALVDTYGGLYFRYVDNVNSGKWEAVTRTDPNETVTDTGVTATTGYTLFRIEVNAGNSSVAYYINGTLVATNTTHIQPSTTRLVPSCGLEKTAGTSARTMEVDYMRLMIDAR